MGAGFVDLDLEDGDSKANKSLTGGRTETYKGIKNYTNRLSFIWYNQIPGTSEKDPIESRYATDTRPKFKGANVAYKKDSGLGFVIYEGDNEFIKSAIGDSKGRVITLVVKYLTDKDGNLIKGAISPERGWEVIPWVMAKQRFDELMKYHKQSPFQTHDILASCENSEFQNFKFISCNEALWRNPKLSKNILSAAATFKEEELLKQLGTIRSDQWILEKLGKGPGSSGNVADLVADAIDLDDLTAGSKAAGGDVPTDYDDLLAP